MIGDGSLLYGYGATGLTQSSDPAFAAPVAYIFDPMGNAVSRIPVAGPYTGLMTDLAEYDAFGDLQAYIPSTIPNRAIPSKPLDPVGYGGQWGNYTDVESRNGLVVMGYRVYDPTYGRFVTRDPIGYEGGINLYAYAGNNPINAADPTGLDTVVTREPGGRLVFTTNIAFTGEGVSQKVVDQISESIASRWNQGAANWHFNYKFVVKAHIYGSGDIGRIMASAASNHMYLYLDDVITLQNSKGRSWVERRVPADQQRPYWTGRAGTWYLNPDAPDIFTYGHEYGHLLGLRDRYQDQIVDGRRISVPDPGGETWGGTFYPYSLSIMADSRADVSILDLRHLQQAVRMHDPGKRP